VTFSNSSIKIVLVVPSIFCRAAASSVAVKSMISEYHYLRAVPILRFSGLHDSYCYTVGPAAGPEPKYSNTINISQSSP
jgi:hypothetical protein